MSAAIAASSRFVVITPENEAQHPFLVQIDAVAHGGGRSRVRVAGPVGGDQRAWLVVCRKYVGSSRQRFREVLWFSAENGDIERLVRLLPQQAAPPESGAQRYSYVETELSREHMRRAYINIDYPRPVDDGGAYYSIDLAFYLEGSAGRKSTIQWDTQ
ncbi:MAG TPA: hypothetical protein VLS27_13560 [Gammaproteobacteria bacterium]|nr:hypothetical protein [Gammaproteobacteria bacterium]